MKRRVPCAAFALFAACGGSPDAGTGLPLLDPGAAGFDAGRLEAIGTFLDAEVARGAFPGGVFMVGKTDGIAFSHATGVFGTQDDRPVGEDVIYDLASLTKVIGLTTASYLLLAEGRITLDDRVRQYLPTFTGYGKDAITIRQLLTHTSGLKAWIPLHLETPDREGAYQRIDADTLANQPGVAYTYSDLGAITMGRVVTAVSGQSLDEFLRTRLFDPLGMEDSQFNPPAALLPRIAPTEYDSVWRMGLVHGTVHDENAHHLGGVSGHAGLFSTAPDLARFAMWLLARYHDRPQADGLPSLPGALVREMTARQPGPEGSTRAIGWDTPNPGGGGSAGSLLSPASFGHTGFTGTSIWIDPVRDLYIILLTNRVHPTRENLAVLSLRGQVADMVIQALIR